MPNYISLPSIRLKVSIINNCGSSEFSLLK